MIIYKWRDGSRITGCSAEDAMSVLEHLRQTGPLTANRVTEAAADPGCPLHRIRQYYWDDDSRAAHEHRLHVSRRVIRSVVLVTRDEGRKREDPINVFVLTRTSAPQHEQQYQRIDVVVQDRQMMDASMRLAREYLDRAQRAVLELAQVQDRRSEIEAIFQRLHTLVGV